MPAMSPEVKRLLAGTIRELRAFLLDRLDQAVRGTYRLDIKVPRQADEATWAAKIAAKTGLSATLVRRRLRLERNLDEQARAVGGGAAATERALADLVKETASTWLLRLVLLRLMEEVPGLRPEAVIKGGWTSPGYVRLREFAPGITGDDTAGYAFLLGSIFDDLSRELPGLYGRVGLSELVPVPASVLRELVEKLNDPALASCWSDDMTLGWVYQYWNDPEREALDEKLNEGGKIEPHEIAAKTQMFTERYIVEWLLQNSLGQIWLAICEKKGWTPDCKRPGHDGKTVLERLEARRVEWRARRAAGSVPLDVLMPIENRLEDCWKYWVQQPLAVDAAEHAPDSIRKVKLLDPACGSGHFLIGALDLLFALYEEEARHRGERWAPESIVHDICGKNLHGLDIDPHAIRVAAAALLLKAKTLAPRVQLDHLNLVASNLRLANLPKKDPAVIELLDEVARATNFSKEPMLEVLEALRGADHLGTLLRVDTELENRLEDYEQKYNKALRTTGNAVQGDLLSGEYRGQQYTLITPAEAKVSILEKLESFLARKTSQNDLGLRLRGEQLAAGIRFIRMVRENQYDLVIGNPPYQGTARMVDATYVARNYAAGKVDLYAAFLLRGLQLVKQGGMSAMLTMRNWMFLKQFSRLREELLSNHTFTVLADFDRGAFEEIPDEVVSVCASVFRASNFVQLSSVAVLPTPLDDRSRDVRRTARKRAALLIEPERFIFSVAPFFRIDGVPITYWWSRPMLADYIGRTKLGETATVRQGIATSDNTRFLRTPLELVPSTLALVERTSSWNFEEGIQRWVPFVKGAEGRVWFEPVDAAIRWDRRGLEMKIYAEHLYESYTRTIKNEQWFFRPAVSFTTIGNRFAARIVRYLSSFDVRGSCVITDDVEEICAVMNASKARTALESLNPGVNFQVGDVNRLPLFPVSAAADIFATLGTAFGEHEGARETSVEFKHPGPSAWAYAQKWAQQAVDRSDGAEPPVYEPVYEPAQPEALVSYAFGVAMGRFAGDGSGICLSAPESALKHGLLFLAATAELDDHDTLGDPACAFLRATWAERGPSIAPDTTLRDYLRDQFFKKHHRPTYENRPIYLPLSSASRNFVVWASIHRWTPQTLQNVLAEYLRPEQIRLEGELADLRAARGTKARIAALSKLADELAQFIRDLQACAEQGPPPSDAKTPAREEDVRFVMDLDDGVMINAAALWPVLEPQWRDPKKWWKELATAEGRKDYDWSQLAARYFPKRVDKKCKDDPSLAVAHRCFWAYHPERAFAWELRLQDEIAPDFTIDEPGREEARRRWLADNAQRAEELILKEQLRREKKRQKRAEADEEDTAEAVDTQTQIAETA